MRNVEFPELEHAKAQAEEERERVCRFKNRSAWPTLRGLCGFTVSCSHQNRFEVDDDHRKRLGEKGWARRSVVVCAVGPSGAAVFEAVLGREEYGSGEDGAVEWEKNMLEFADGNFNDAGMRYERRDVERQRARWHDPVLRRWLGLTPKRPALCLRGLPRRPRAALKRDKLGGIRKNRGVGGAG